MCFSNRVYISIIPLFLHETLFMCIIKLLIGEYYKSGIKLTENTNNLCV